VNVRAVGKQRELFILEEVTKPLKTLHSASVGKISWINVLCRKWTKSDNLVKKGKKSNGLCQGAAPDRGGSGGSLFKGSSDIDVLRESERADGAGGPPEK